MTKLGLGLCLPVLAGASASGLQSGLCSDEIGCVGM